MREIDSQLVSVPGIEESHGRDVGLSYDLLRSLVIGSRFLFQGAVLELREPTELERKLMTKSREEKREFGLVVVGQTTKIITGTPNEMFAFDVVVAVLRMGGFGHEASFTHTHWNTNGYPLPSSGDLFGADFIKSKNPLFDCRTAFLQEHQTRIISYIGKL